MPSPVMQLKVISSFDNDVNKVHENLHFSKVKPTQDGTFLEFYAVPVIHA